MFKKLIEDALVAADEANGPAVPTNIRVILLALAAALDEQAAPVVPPAA